MTDRSIIELLKERDERGLTEIEQAYGGRLRRIAESLLSKEDAEVGKERDVHFAVLVRDEHRRDCGAIRMHGCETGEDDDQNAGSHEEGDQGGIGC